MTPGAPRPALMALIVIGMMVTALPLVFIGGTADPGLHSKTFAIGVIGAALLLTGTLRGRLWDNGPPLRQLLPAALLALWLVLTTALSHWALAGFAALWPMLVGLGVFALAQSSAVTPRRVAALWGLLASSTVSP